MMIFVYDLIDYLFMLVLALIMDILFGEPPYKLHPTVWMGKLAKALKPKMKSKYNLVENINGFLLAVILTFFIFYITHVVISYLNQINYFAYIFISSFFLKSSFSIRLMINYSRKICQYLKLDKIDYAKRILSNIVRRDVRNLSKDQVISGTIESIAESTTDGIVGPLFFFFIAGVPGAVTYRFINTLDSVLGYKDDYHKRIGFFSAKMDTIANYVPARITALLIALSAFFLKLDWKNSLIIMFNHHKRTESVNAGWPMSAMAGALRIKLQKPNHYELGEGIEQISYVHITTSLKIMVLTTAIFIFIISLFTLILGQNLKGWFIEL